RQPTTSSRPITTAAAPLVCTAPARRVNLEGESPARKERHAVPAGGDRSTGRRRAPLAYVHRRTGRRAAGGRAQAQASSARGAGRRSGVLAQACRADAQEPARGQGQVAPNV